MACHSCQGAKQFEIRGILVFCGWCAPLAPDVHENESAIAEATPKAQADADIPTPGSSA